MDTHVGQSGYRNTRRTALLVLLLGVMSIVPIGAAAQSGPDSTVGEIVVDSYDCDTGLLRFHVPVTDLPHYPDDSDPAFFPFSLRHTFSAEL